MWDRLTIFKKGLVLISAPLLFQLIFFGLLADMQSSNAEAVKWSFHSKEVLRQTQLVLRSLLEMGTGMRGFILSADPDLGAAYEKAAQQLPHDVRALQDSVKDNETQAVHAQAIADAIREYMDWHDGAVRLRAAGRQEEAIERVRGPTGGRLHNGIVQSMMAFIKSEDSLDKERTHALEESRLRHQRLLWTGAGTTFLVTLGLAFVFSRSIGGRLATLTDNAQHLARGEELAPPVPGSDEVAVLDRAFRCMAEEVRHLNEGLERRIGERTDELARANEALREADRHKDDFLAMLSHELRNPLAPVRNGLQILKTPGVAAEAARKAREMMERQVLHLIRLVDDLLDVSRIVNGKIKLHKGRVDLATVFARAVETAQPKVDARGQTLAVSLPPGPVWLEADLVRLAQVVGNLLVNAAKYTDKAGRIWLTGQRDGPEVVIRVRDSGVGIAPDLLPHVFALFVQGDRSLARSEGGLGVGLTLVRNLIELHGGSVTATSPGAGQGSEFTVRLPMLMGGFAEEGGPAEGSANTAGRLRRVLVVDDNVDAAESAATVLRFLGHEVEVAYDGPSALGAVRGFRPEIVLLDIGLPGMNGYDVARQLRTLPEAEGLVLAAVTGYGRDEDRRRSREAGFDYHLTKPLAPGELASFVAAPG